LGSTRCQPSETVCYSINKQGLAEGMRFRACSRMATDGVERAASHLEIGMAYYAVASDRVTVEVVLVESLRPPMAKGVGIVEAYTRV